MKYKEVKSAELMVSCERVGLIPQSKNWQDNQMMQ